MHGLPDDVDLSFLVGKELIQVCIGRHQLILHFDEGVSIFIESEFCHTTPMDYSISTDNYIASASLLSSLLTLTITSATSELPGTLCLVLSNGDVLRVYDTNERYESYQIAGGGPLIVV